MSFLSCLPSDLFTFILSFLSPKELCSLDTAILNHNYRPIFLNSLIQRFQKDSYFYLHHSRSHNAEQAWYLSRNIPITSLDTTKGKRLTEFLLKNSNSLKSLNLTQVTFYTEGIAALRKCTLLEKLILWDCNFPTTLEISSVLQHFPNLQELALTRHQFTKTTIEHLFQFCPLLQSLTLSDVPHFGDTELSYFLDHCSPLQLLCLTNLRITNQSVPLLIKNHPHIKLINLIGCQHVSWDSLSLLLRECTLPHIDEDADPELQLSLLNSLRSHFYQLGPPDSRLFELFAERFLSKLRDLLVSDSTTYKLKSGIILFLTTLTECDQRPFLIDLGIVRVILSLPKSLLIQSFRLLSFLTIRVYNLLYLLSVGILSIIPSIYKELNVDETGEVLLMIANLSPLINSPQSQVPLEDWIDLLPFLIYTYNKYPETEDAMIVIHSICLAITSTSHTARAVDCGVLEFLKNQKKNSSTRSDRVLKAISHLASIDSEFRSKIEEGL